jgi:hemerythrin-like domain-containing protein
MALVHNVMIRAYNSIYLQAPKLKPGDVPDFLHYCQAWHETVKGHHESEEGVLFPEIEKATGVKGIMDGDVEEHRK